MVLYTLCDPAAIMANPAEDLPKLREVELANGVMLVGRDEDKGFRIERVLSSNANAYLLPEYQPGSLIRLG